MAAYYDLILSTAPLTEDMIHRLYQILQDALDDSPSSEVEARIYDLVIYVRYLELLDNWKSDGLVTTFSAMIEWMWRARNTDLMGYRISHDTSSWKTGFEALEVLYPGYSFTPFSTKPWNDEPFTTAELDIIIRNGIDNNDLLTFTPIGYSEDLVYQARPHDTRPRASFNYSNRNHSWYLWIREDQHEFTVPREAAFKMIEKAVDFYGL